MRWLVRGLLSRPVILFSLIVLYFNAPSVLGIEPLDPFDLIDWFSRRLELLVAITGVVIAVVAAKGFLDSKRLDMRLSAAADIQGLSQRVVDRASKRVQLAEVLVEFSRILGSRDFAEASDEQRERLLGDALAGLQVAYAADKDEMVDIWILCQEAISHSIKHGIALQNSLVAFLSQKKAMAEMEKLASLCSFDVPADIDDLEYLSRWFRATDQRAAEACSLEGISVAGKASLWLGAAAGALGKGVFSTSGGVALIMLKDIRDIWRKGAAQPGE